MTEKEQQERALYFRRERRRARRKAVNHMASEAYEHILRDLRCIPLNWENIDEGFSGATTTAENLTLRAMIKLNRRFAVLVNNAGKELDKRSKNLTKQRRRALKQQYKEKVLAELAARGGK